MKMPDSVWVQLEDDWGPAEWTGEPDEGMTEYTRTDLVPRWIPVSEPPEGEAEVYVHCVVDGIDCFWQATFADGEWWRNPDDSSLSGVTHWMPVPPLGGES